MGLCGDSTFELVTAEGSRVRVTTDPATDGHGIAYDYSGPWGELEDHDPWHPFRGEEHGQERVEYRSVAVRRDEHVEV